MEVLNIAICWPVHTKSHQLITVVGLASSHHPCVGVRTCLPVAACRYVNGADPNRRLSSFRNLADTGGSSGAGVDPLLKDWQLIEGEPAHL